MFAKISINNIIEELFKCNKKYDVNEYWKFLEDKNFNEYLEKNFPYLKEFLKSCEIIYSENNVGIAGIVINPQKDQSSKECILYLNPPKVEFIIIKC